MPRLWFILFPCCWFWLLVHGYGSKIRPKLSNILVMCGIELLNIQFPICRYLMLIHIHSQTSMFHPIYIYTFNYHHFYVLRSYIYIYLNHIYDHYLFYFYHIYYIYILFTSLCLKRSDDLTMSAADPQDLTFQALAEVNGEVFSLFWRFYGYPLVNC